MEVLSRQASEKEDAPCWYGYSINSIKPWANVGHLFSKTMNQEQGNTSVNGLSPSSFVTLSPLGYARIKIKTYETRKEYE
jgi:hypothetical protein